MNKIKYSVVIPVYNKEEYLEDCIRSVISQNFSNLEIIIINDGSKDKSLQICTDLANTDKRIRIIDKQNSGVSDTRNVGIDNAIGEYILFLDADDIWSSSLLTEVDKYIDKKELLMFRSCRDIRLLDSDKEALLKTFRNNISTLKSVVYNQHLINDCAANFNRVTDYVVSTKLLKENNIKFTTGIRIGEDKLFNFKLFQHVKEFSFLNQYLYYIRTNNKSVMGSYNSKALEINEKMLEAFNSAVDELNEEESKQELKDLISCLGYQVVWNSITSDYCHKDNTNKYKTRKMAYNLSQKYLLDNSLRYLSEYDRYLFKVFKYPFFLVNIIMKHRIIRGGLFYISKAIPF